MAALGARQGLDDDLLSDLHGLTFEDASLFLVSLGGERKYSGGGDQFFRVIFDVIDR